MLQRGRAMTASVTLYGTIWYYCKTPPPPPPRPCLFLCCLLSLSAVRRPSSAARHPPPVIRCLLLSQNSPPNLVDCRRRHRPLSSHHSPRQHYDIAPAIVAVTPQCRSRETFMSTSSLALTAFASLRRPLAEQRCRVRSHVASRCSPLPLSLLSLSSPHCSHHCCHPYIWRDKAAR